MDWHLLDISAQNRQINELEAKVEEYEAALRIIGFVTNGIKTPTIQKIHDLCTATLETPFGMPKEPVYRQYRRTAIAEMTDWTPEFDMTDVSVSMEDLKNGSPKEGDKIARNPKNHNDKWLVNAEYFKDNFEEI